MILFMKKTMKKIMKKLTEASTAQCVFLLLSINVCSSVYAFENLNTSAKFGIDRAFIGANILNPHIDHPISSATVLVSQGRIVKIQPGTEIVPENYTVVDVKNKWLIPGLIDGHIHMAQSGGAFTRPDTFDATKISSYEADQQWLQENLASIFNNYLALGITTVFDMGGPSEYLQHYRAMTSEGTYPDIYAAGALISPMAVAKLSINGETFTKVDNAEEAIVQVRKQLALNTDIIKIVWTQETGLTMAQLSDMFAPAITLAKEHNKVIAVHVEGLENAKMAIKAGADILVHGVLTDPIDIEFINLMKSHNVTYMPTLTVYEHYFELFKNELTFTEFERQYSHDEVIASFKTLTDNASKADQIFQILLQYVPRVDDTEEQLATLSEQGQAIVKQLRTLLSSKTANLQKINLKEIIDADVNVAFGTDAGNPGTLHASSVYGEFIAWQQAGISNREILKAATLGNAKALNLDNKLGTLTTGKYANFVVLDHNPYKMLSTLTTPVMTIKRGIVINAIKGGMKAKR